MEYFDESLFDIGFLHSSSGTDSIPITLGSIGSSINAPDNVADTNACAEMPLTMPPVQFHTANHHNQEPYYVNTAPLQTGSCYEERPEGHYARLSELNVSSVTPAEAPTSARSGLNFYVQKAAEQRARSRSRGPETGQRGRSRSARSRQPRSRSRGCSASRDIMALYTNRPVSTCKLREASSSPERDSISHGRRRQSISPETKDNKQKGQSKKVSTTKRSPRGESKPKPQVLSKPANNNNIYSPKSSGVETSPNPSTTGKSSFMTLLEMDVETNAQIEKDLLAANSLKPANIKMMMIAHHAPNTSWACKDEVSVKAGDIVTGIYKQNQWLYIMTESKSVGFVPYAFTKPVKVMNNTKQRGAEPKTITKPVNGILKTSNHGKQKSRKSHPKYSVKVRTAADNDSLSSESSSAYTADDFVYTRNKSHPTKNHADCIVVDTDDIGSPLELSHSVEETGTYCSDSGISDPMSNHSEDLDLLHSPISHDSGVSVPTSTPTYLPTSTPRLPKERIVSVTTELLANSPYNSIKPAKESSEARTRFHGSATISDMPLGPLGARLAKISMGTRNTNKTDHMKLNKKLDSDTQDRARCSSTTPLSLRPEIPKDYNGPRVTVVFDYNGDNQDDLTVHSSDVVTVLNSEDIEWIWVQRRDGKEGFIPRDYVIPLELSAQNRRRVGISLL